jgi:pilus assembly protein CpaE
VTDLRIILATPNAGYEQRVRQAFEATLNGDLRRWSEPTDVADPRQLILRLADVTPDVIAIGPGVELDAALALARQLEVDRPEISVLLIAPPTPQLWREAMRAGVTDVLTPEAIDVEVRTAFDRALDVAARRRRNLIGDPSTGAERGRIVTVLSPKGGSGKTTVASNLAVGLALSKPDSTVIVDLDVQFGDVATALRLAPDHSVVDAARGGGPVDVMALKTFLTPHPSGLWALCGPDDPAFADDLSAERARAVVEALAEEFETVIVDTCAGLSEHTLSILEVTTDFLLVCAMDVPSVRSLRKEIDALDKLGMTSQRRHFVINRADSKVGLDMKDVEATVGLQVDIALPSSRAVPLSTNQGTPLVESEPRSQVARQLMTLIARFADQPVTRSGGLLRRMKDAR